MSPSRRVILKLCISVCDAASIEMLLLDCIAGLITYLLDPRGCVSAIDRVGLDRDLKKIIGRYLFPLAEVAPPTIDDKRLT